jgi:CHAD domain-containing protein
VLQHYVLLKYRDGTTDGHVDAFCERMRALRDTIGEMQHLEIGRDELRDARSWDLVLIMQFASAEALRVYQRHPDHLAVMGFNDPFVANVASIDFTR